MRPPLVPLGLIASSFVGCSSGGVSLEFPDEAAWSWLVLVDGDALRIERLESALAFSREQIETPFVVRVPETRLAAAVSSLDRTRLDSVELAVDPERDMRCVDGEIERRVDRTLHKELWAPSVGEVYELTDLETPPYTIPREVWPAELRDLVLRAPIREPCSPLPAAARGFGDRPRLIELGEMWLSATIGEENVHRTNVVAADYVDEDHLLLTFANGLAVLGRGSSASSAVIVSNGHPALPPLAPNEEGWQFIHSVLVPGEEPRRRGFVLLSRLGEHHRFSGIGIGEFTVTATAFSSIRLRHLIPSSASLCGADNLRAITARRDGAFAAVGRNFVVSAPGNGPVTVAPAPRVDGTALVFFPEPSMNVLIQQRSGGWWSGDPTTPESLTLERSDTGVVESGGSIRLVSGTAGPRPVSGTEVGDLWERLGPGDWLKHRWWLPEDARACASPDPVCGRTVPRPFYDLQDLGPIGERVLHTFEACNAIFATTPNSDLCSQMLPIDWDAHRLRTNSNSICCVAVRGQRAAFVGDGGLVLEVTVD